MLENWMLKQRQSLPLTAKIQYSKNKIKEFYEKMGGRVYVSFSGGKDSTVLLHLVRSIFPRVPAVFVDTGLEWPEIREFVKTVDNVVWLKPKMSFKEVLEKYGYPVISKEVAQKLSEIRSTKSEKLLNKRLYGQDGNGKLPEKWKFLIKSPFKISSKCCDKLKKDPIKRYEKETGESAIVGTMACESSLRKTSYLRKGCNPFGKRAMSSPLSIWSEQDIYDYTAKYGLKISSIYNKGAKRTGCIFCMFGAHNKNDNRFELLKQIHPQLYKYCMVNLGIGEVIEYIKKGLSQ